VSTLQDTDVIGFPPGTKPPFGSEADSSKPTGFRNDKTFFFYFLFFFPAAGQTGTLVADASGNQVRGEPVFF
jgi:hypothetical protein